MNIDESRIPPALCIISCVALAFFAIIALFISLLAIIFRHLAPFWLTVVSLIGSISFAALGFLACICLTTKLAREYESQQSQLAEDSGEMTGDGQISN